MPTGQVQIMGLTLDADLVALSACQTGLGALVRGGGWLGSAGHSCSLGQDGWQ